MNVFTSLFARLYAKLILLYPQPFRGEFGTEMQVAFRESVEEAGAEGILPLALVCLREVVHLPASLLREFWHEVQGKELIMLRENASNPPATPGQVLMGALPFLLFSSIMVMLELPIALFEQDWFNALGNISFFTFLIFPAIGFGIGWVQNFPRWSYPYAGMAVILAIYIQYGSTPGLNFFGIPIFGRELWGWRAWIPLAASFVIALAVSRSFKPFVRFFTNLWNDWTIPSYLMLGILPLLVMVVFDEMDRLYTLYFMITFAVLFVGMVILYLRSQSTAQRVLILTLGVVVIVFSAGLGSNSFWLAHNGTFTTNAEMSVQAGKIAFVILIPAWLEMLRRWLGRLNLA